MGGWAGTYSYTIISVKKKRFTFDPFKPYIALVSHNGKILKIGISDPTYDGAFGYDHDICFAIYLQLYKDNENDKAGKNLEVKTVRAKCGNLEDPKDNDINTIIANKSYKSDVNEQNKSLD